MSTPAEPAGITTPRSVDPTPVDGSITVTEGWPPANCSVPMALFGLSSTTGAIVKPTCVSFWIGALVFPPASPLGPMMTKPDGAKVILEAVLDANWRAGRVAGGTRVSQGLQVVLRGRGPR